ncbi:plant-specific domain TIGR01615 family protein [Musa troglodytarum]|uniref:Plant-specific domain TIGR01615 family protein n=1 Tax=Musa troglodytarum TaxID=320322 RepID=A0A9E7H491_9LILI|nr:plant-specific domain TIGR01615 family protein [Musa troglodytarum]
MPFPTKIQPIDVIAVGRSDLAKPVLKSRLKRLFERQFPGVLRISSAERLAGGADLELSSICLDKMVRNFMEDNNGEQTSYRSCRSRCNCFHGNCHDSSDDDLDLLPSSFNSGDPPIASAAEVVKGLVVCPSLVERNILADASSVVEKNKNCKRKDEQMKAVANGLRLLGYDASICKSRWEKTPSFPAGEHEYIDVIVAGERLLVDVDFRSEFEIARSTKSYAAVLQSLPPVFVGKEDRVDQIVAVVSEAAQQSLKKKGLHFPPWRKPEYMRSKWLAPYERSTPLADPPPAAQAEETGESDGKAKSEKLAEGKSSAVLVVAAASAWEPPEVKPKAVHKGAKVVTGLTSVLSDSPGLQGAGRSGFRKGNTRKMTVHREKNRFKSSSQMNRGSLRWSSMLGHQERPNKIPFFSFPENPEHDIVVNHIEFVTPLSLKPIKDLDSPSPIRLLFQNYSPLLAAEAVFPWLQSLI